MVNNELLDNRIRPIFITYNNKTRTLAISDGKGNVYLPTGETYMATEDELLPENLLDPKDFVYERGLSGFDF
jgi:hypothetical protein